jgi:gas vesicle protein
MSTGRIVLGVISGIAIGATLGILLAPNSGEVTRRKISRRTRDYADDLGDKMNDLMDTVSEKFEITKKEVSQLAEKAKEKAENAEIIKSSYNSK